LQVAQQHHRGSYHSSQIHGSRKQNVSAVQITFSLITLNFTTFYVTQKS